MTAARLPESVIGNPGLQKVLAALAPCTALIVGGAVRNALLGEPVDDIDIATELRPQRVIDLARSAGLKAVPTGIDHGTVTVVADGEGFEITTFRRDLETDGRRAVVEYADRIEDDAARRDFTINALYAGADGVVIDPVGGLPDLAARRLRFVGDPDQRIAEDYLRILRFFRFHARYGRPGDWDGPALAACEAGAAGLDRISRERIGAEMRKLLDARDPVEAVRLMRQTGVLDRLLPDANVERMAALVALEQQLGGQSGQQTLWPLRLAALGVPDAAHRLRLSRDEARILDELRFAGSLPDAAQTLGAVRASQIAMLRAADGTPLGADWRDQIDFAASQRLPISAADLVDRLAGPALGRGLKAARAAWIESGFVLPAPALIDIALLAGKD